MKCIILAAGEGVRMRPLTLSHHKSMLPILKRPIMEHILADLPEEVNEVIMVVGHLRHTIQNHFGGSWGRFSIQYIVQEGKLGTCKALELCRPHLREEERFLLMYADDLHDAEAIRNAVQSGTPCLVVKEAEDPRKFGVIEVADDGCILSIEEKPENPKTNLVAVGVQVLDTRIFDYPAAQHPNGEYYLTDSISKMIQAGHQIQTVRSNFWLPIGYPQDLIEAERMLMQKA